MSGFLFRWAGHSHVCRGRGEGGRSLGAWVEEMRARGLDYFGFGYPWEPWDLQTLREWELDPERARLYHDEAARRKIPPETWLRTERFALWEKTFSRDGFTFGIELEMPKVRYGHLWWLGWRPEGLAPWHDADKPWTAWEVSPARALGAPPPPFRRRWPAQMVRAQRAMGGLPVCAHPTSWWTAPNGAHVTNIAATLVPDLLTGQFPGCLVVMGYDADHRSYQELWFSLLDKGFFLTGVAETDACLDSPDPFPRGLHHNAATVETPGLSGLIRALEKGANIMTTGPLLKIACGEAGPGGHVGERGGLVGWTLSGLDARRLHKLEFIHNGRVEWAREIAGREHAAGTILHEGSGWLVARLTCPSHPATAALTNPIFFGRAPRRVTSEPLPGQIVAWWRWPGAEDLALYLASGRWREDHPGCEPGRVPFAAFRWDDWHALLEKHAPDPAPAPEP